MFREEAEGDSQASGMSNDRALAKDTRMEPRVTMTMATGTTSGQKANERVGDSSSIVETKSKGYSGRGGWKKIHKELRPCIERKPFKARPGESRTDQIVRFIREHGATVEPRTRLEVSILALRRAGFRVFREDSGYRVGGFSHILSASEVEEAAARKASFHFRRLCVIHGHAAPDE